MDMRYLEEIVEVAACGSFSKAAESLFITQSALSKHVSSVEREFGIVIFDRSGGKLELTEGGSLFVEGARDILARSRLYLSQVRKASNDSAKSFVVAGNLRRDSTFQGVASAVGQLTARYPSARVDLQDIGVRDYVDILQSGKADVIVSYLYPEVAVAGLAVRRLHEAPFAVTVHKSHPFAERESVSFEDLSELDVYVYEHEERDMYHSYLRSVFTRHGVPPATRTQPSFYCGFPNCESDVLASPYFPAYEMYYPDYRCILLDWPSEVLETGLIWIDQGSLDCAEGSFLLSALIRELKDVRYKR